MSRTGRGRERSDAVERLLIVLLLLPATAAPHDRSHDGGRTWTVTAAPIPAAEAGAPR